MNTGEPQSLREPRCIWFAWLVRNTIRVESQVTQIGVSYLLTDFSVVQRDCFIQIHQGFRTSLALTSHTRLFVDG